MTSFTKAPSGLLFNPDNSLFGAVNPVGDELAIAGVVASGSGFALTTPSGGRSQVSGSAVDAASFTLALVHANTVRAPSVALTYTLDLTSAFAVGDGVIVFLPTAGAISFATAGGVLINGNTPTLTRVIGANPLGYVVLNRVAAANSYTLSGV